MVAARNLIEVVYLHRMKHRRNETLKQQVFSQFVGKMIIVVGIVFVLTIALVLSNGGSAAHAQASYNYVGVLPSGASLGVNGTVVSPNGVYVLTMQGDGNLVEGYTQGGVIWASNSTGSGGSSFNAAMQSDGNFVVYCHGNGCKAYRAIFSTCTYGDNYSHLEVQNDGNVVVYTPSHRAVWARTWNHNCG